MDHSLVHSEGETQIPLRMTDDSGVLMQHHSVGGHVSAEVYGNQNKGNSTDAERKNSVTSARQHNVLLSPSAVPQELPGAVVSSRGHVASGTVLFDQASTEASAVSALKTNAVASLKRQREIPAEPAPRGEGNGRRALLPAFDRADELAQGVGGGRPREQWSEVDVEEEDDSNLAQGRETQSAFMRAVNYQDDLAICIRCENIGYDVSKYWQIKRGGRQPGAVYQQNEMVSRLAKHVNVLASQFPPLSHGSRLLPKTKQYPNGAFILRFNTKKQSINQ
jgi:hypothetical protein